MHHFLILEEYLQKPASVSRNSVVVEHAVSAEETFHTGPNID